MKRGRGELQRSREKSEEDEVGELKTIKGLGSTVSFSECGGFEIEENWDKVKTLFLPTNKPMTLETCAPLIATPPSEVSFFSILLQQVYFHKNL
ncbi:hypothetical protein V6N13_091142 [Hibiscus sabdariffa]